ncbi:hypothetical protein Tco_0072712 [Tanacetum coccineum]
MICCSDLFFHLVDQSHIFLHHPLGASRKKLQFLELFLSSDEIIFFTRSCHNYSWTIFLKASLLDEDHVAVEESDFLLLEGLVLPRRRGLGFSDISIQDLAKSFSSTYLQEVCVTLVFFSLGFRTLAFSFPFSTGEDSVCGVCDGEFGGKLCGDCSGGCVVWMVAPFVVVVWFEKYYRKLQSCEMDIVVEVGIKPFG